MIYRTLFSLLLLIWLPVQAQNEVASEYAGFWSGTIQADGEELGIRLTFSFRDDILDGSIDIPLQQAYNYPVEVTEFSDEGIVFQFETGTGPALFYGKRSGNPDVIEGEFEQGGRVFPFVINRRILSGGWLTNPQAEDLIIPTRAGQISGTLLLQEEPAPLVILLSGSGSQDRDENVAGFRVFGELSSRLYESGFSSFRYDDRGIGQSQGEPDATLNELAEDLVDIAGYLHEHYENEFSSLYLLGHSQGGLVAAIGAQFFDTDGIIFMATPFLRGDEIINEQILVISRDRDVPEEVVEQNLEFQQRIYEVVRSEGDWSAIEQDLADRLREQIDQLPDQQRQALGDMNGFVQSQVDRQLSAAKSRWFKSLIELEPAEIIGSLEVPMLAIFGGMDMQVTAEPNRAAAQRLHREQPPITTVIIPDANHLFQAANTGMPGEYGMLEREFADGFMDAVLGWLLSFD